MGRGLIVLLALAAAPVAAQGTSTDGIGRISLGGGVRWTPNDHFNTRARELERPNTTTQEPVTAPLGVGGMASFGYGAFDWLELAIDLFGAYESFQLEGWLPFTSVSYGLALGIRVTRYDFPVKGLVPYVGFQSGLMLTTVTSPSQPGNERALQAWSVSGGATYKLTERFGLFLDVRYLHGRVFVAEIAGRSVGGVLASLGLTFFFPAAPKRDLDVPGFGGGSRF